MHFQGFQNPDNDPTDHDAQLERALELADRWHDDTLEREIAARELREQEERERKLAQECKQTQAFNDMLRHILGP
jgi:hypothetical protein